MKKWKEVAEYEVKCTFWGHLEFVQSSLELSEASEEIGKPWTLFQSEHLLKFILIKKHARISFSETLISHYQGNPSLWDHNAAEDLLLDLLNKELNEKFTCDEIVRKWKCLAKIYKQENSKAKHKPSGSGTKDIYISTWEFSRQLHFLDSICDDTDATVDSIMDQPEAKSRKRSKVAERDEREDKKL